MGAVLLAAGATGKRYALPNSRIMIHQGSSRLPGQHPGRRDPDAGEPAPAEPAAARSSPTTPARTSRRSRRDSDRDYFMSPEEAKAYGLIDEVFVGNNESLISLAQKKGGEMPTAEEAAEADKVKK